MHIYIHIPFCNSKCPYCAFGSYTNKFNLVESYFKALEFEIKDFFEKNIGEISTIFIGGGTPSAVKVEYYKPIFKILRPYLKKRAEITTEANPNSANYEWLSKMRSYGINRVSFGAQSFDEKKLNLLGRNHNSTDIKKAVKNAKRAGFKKINLDLIYSTKLDIKELLKSEVANLKALKPTHISAYSLTLEEKTPFFGRLNLRHDSPNLAKFLFKELENAGFKQYEISNFGQICRHNLAYWRQKDYVGFGAFSVSFKKDRRFYASLNLQEYLQNPLKREIEYLSKSELKTEHIFLGLRSNLGIKAQILDKIELEKCQNLVKAKKLKFENAKFKNPNFLLADEIALYIR